MLIKSIKILIILFFTLTLSACDGGDGDSNTYKERETELAPNPNSNPNPNPNPNPDPNPDPNDIIPRLEVRSDCPNDSVEERTIVLVVEGTGTGTITLQINQDDTKKAAGQSYESFIVENTSITANFVEDDRDGPQTIIEPHIKAGHTYDFIFKGLNPSNTDCDEQEMRVLTQDDVNVMEGVYDKDIGRVCLFDNDDIKSPNSNGKYKKKFCNALIYISDHTNDE